MVNLDEYERKVEADIRVKDAFALVTEARKRKEETENFEKLPPERIVFIGKKLYSEKDVVEATKSDDSSNDMDQKNQKASNKWRQEFLKSATRVCHFQTYAKVWKLPVNMMGKICLLPA